MSKSRMRGHFRYLRFKTFPMTPRTRQCEVFWSSKSSSELSGVPEDSNPNFFQVLGFTPTLGQSRVATSNYLTPCTNKTKHSKYLALCINKTKHSNVYLTPYGNKTKHSNWLNLYKNFTKQSRQFSPCRTPTKQFVSILPCQVIKTN